MCEGKRVLFEHLLEPEPPTFAQRCRMQSEFFSFFVTYKSTRDKYSAKGLLSPKSVQN